MVASPVAIEAGAYLYQEHNHRKEERSMRDEDQTKKPGVTEVDECRETTPRDSAPAGEHLAAPAADAVLIDAEIARLAAQAARAHRAGPDHRAPQEGEG
jgi:hypothetical protein